MKSWSTALPDWEKRIIAGESIVPCGPIFEEEAAKALLVFNSLKIVDAPGQPTFGEAGGKWVEDLVATIFGAYNAETGVREINEFFLCVAKKNGKSLIAAGIMLTALIRNWRRSNELIIVAPTIKAAGNAFKPAADMVRADPKLYAREHGFLDIQDHLRTITHVKTGATLRILAADTSTVAGNKAGFVLFDELWELANKSDADGMMREAGGGIVARPEGFTIYISTMADKPPVGPFKDKLNYARNVRDGVIADRRFLPVIYEFPDRMIEASEYEKPENFRITNPFLGLTTSGVDWIANELAKEKEKGPETRNIFLSKHLNIEIGQRHRTDGWPGSFFWEKRADKSIAGEEGFQAVLDRSEVVVVGIDGGGLDDLLGFCVMGREKVTRRWLVWNKAWCHPIVLERRKDIASTLRTLEAAGELRIIAEETDEDVVELCEYVERIRDARLFPEEKGIGCDPVGTSDITDELVRRGFAVGREDDQEDIGEVFGVKQGFKLNDAIDTLGRRVAQGKMIHGGSALMAWCVGNAKMEPKGNARMVTKGASHSAKIDPLVATFVATKLMAENPTIYRSVYEDRGPRFG